MRFAVSLIHNHQATRNAYLLPRLEALTAHLGGTLSLHAWQPPVAGHRPSQALGRELDYVRVGLAWSRYCGNGIKTRFDILRHLVERRLPKYILRGDRLTRYRRQSFIETLVTAKHIAAWHGFLEGPADCLIVCEDDMVFKPDSIARLDAAIAAGDFDRADGLRYVDLAGGFGMAELAIDRLVVERHDGRIRFRRATTNTACCYVLSRPLAGQFVDRVVRNPALRLIGIDWMVNALLMELDADGLACDALHYEPTIFDHGTFTGHYTSWMQKADHGQSVAPVPLTIGTSGVGSGQ